MTATARLLWVVMTAAVAMLATAAVAQLQIAPRAATAAAPAAAREKIRRRAAAAGCQEAGRAEKGRAEIGRQPEGDEGAGAAGGRNAARDRQSQCRSRLRRYQSGRYGEAFRIATRRAQELNDAKAMTLLGELYANGQGVNRDDKKAAEWYKQAADRGDREATFALAMMRMSGRGGPANRDEAAKLLAFAARLGSAPAAYNLALLNIEGQVFPQDLGRAAGAVPSGGGCGKLRGAVRARDLLQGRPRRREEPGRGYAPFESCIDRRQPRCAGGIRSRPVQRHRHAEGRSELRSCGYGRLRDAAVRSRRTGSRGCWPPAWARRGT